MNSICKKAISSFLVIICLVSQLLLHTACFSLKYKTDQPRENMTSIEIVEADYSLDTEMGTQIVLVSIDDIDSFLEKLNKIKYRAGVSDPRGIYSRTLAIKISYQNGDYEVFNSGDKSSSKSEYGGYRSRPFGWYDKEFYDLLFSYLNDVEKCKFNYMHETSEIVSIEIVNSTIIHEEDFVYSVEKLAVIEDHSKFIEELDQIKYVYYTDEILGNTYLEKDQSNAIKITYENGDYEIFTYNHRDEIIMMENGVELTNTGTYIGTFDEDAFNNLVARYLPE